MDDKVYTTRIKKVKVAELALNDSIKRFNSKAVSDLDLSTYQSSLKDIKKELKVFVDNINDILVDLEGNDPRKDGLEAKKVEHFNEVIKNQN